jgi:hypothetical protein
MEVKPGHLDASSRDEIYEENCWVYTSGPQKKLKKTCKLNHSLNLFRITMPIGRTALKEWILTESQTNFCTTDHMEKRAGNRNRPPGLILDENAVYFGGSSATSTELHGIKTQNIALFT